MSSTMTNIDIKKILSGYGLYEGNMSVADMQEMLNMVKSLERRNLYEKGMKVKDVKEVFKTIERSKYEVTEHQNIDITGNESDSKESVVSNPDSPKEIEVPMLKTNTDTDIILEKLRKEITIKKIISNSPDHTKTNNNNKNINVFIPNHSRHFKQLKLKPTNKLIYQHLQHQPIMQKFSLQSRVKILYQLHLYQTMKLKQSQRNIITHEPIPWGKPIQPSKGGHFNGDLYTKIAAVEQDNHEEEVTEELDEVVEPQQQQQQGNNNNIDTSSLNSTRKSTRRIKRKIYTEEIEDGSGDEFQSTGNKKVKGNQQFQNITVTKAVEQSGTTKTTNENKWFSKNGSKKPGKAVNNCNDRTKKMLTTVLEKTIPSQNPNQENTMCSSSSDDGDSIFPEFNPIRRPKPKPGRGGRRGGGTASTRKKPDPIQLTADIDDDGDDSDAAAQTYEVTADIHKVNSPKLSKDTYKPINYTKRKIANDPLNEEDEITVDDSQAIATNRFYDDNTSHRIGEKSNNNEIEDNSRMECPICQRSYLTSIIQTHASSCTQYNDQIFEEQICQYCNKVVPHTETMENHRFDCMKALTGEDDNSKKQPGNLCSICTTYFINRQEYNKHISECIASLTK